ncbi:MAG: TonB-dependent receptor [Xanthomonadales bacterium]|nr:TonB-dependent receptor [Xanthomonadales bacterium]
MNCSKLLKTAAITACLAAAITLFSVTNLSAQDNSKKDSNDPGAGTTDFDNPTLEEITVTARKRVESLQEVALSVSAMGAQEIKMAFATDVRDLIFISPNTVLDDTSQGPGGVAAAYIRGIGVSEVEKNFDPAVGVVVDGIFRGTMTGSIERAIDLERMEVARGPQGTLFGRNTIGGVIIMEHSKPTGVLGGKFRANYGNYETGVLDGVFNFGIGDKLAVKLTGAYRDQNQGYFTNLVTGRHDGKSEYTSWGVNVLWTPVENLELEYTLQQERTNQDTPPLLNVGQPGQLFCDVPIWGWCSPNTTTPVSGGRYLTLQAYGSDVTNPFPGAPFTPPGYDAPFEGPSGATFDADTNQFEVRWDLTDDYRIDYLIGKWKTDETAVNDWDGVTQILFHTSRPAQYKQLSNELRLTYDAGDKLVYTVGGYYWDSEYQIQLQSYIGFVVPSLVLDLPQFTDQGSKSLAFFGEGDYSFNDNWTLTLGGRWTQDKKTTQQTGIVTAGAKEEWNKFTPKAAIKYTINDASMVYGLLSSGYRAGGFNGRVDSIETATTPYDPETLDNYELGYRSQWADDTLVFNATYFYMDYQNKQEEIQQASDSSGTGQVTRVVNAADATIQGGEFELMWLATDGLTLRANLGLLDAKYDSFVVNTGTSDHPVYTDYSDLNFRRAPKATFSLGGNYAWDVAGGAITLNAVWHYLGAHEVDFANKPELHNDAQNLVDASIDFSNDTWWISGYVRNLLKADGYQIGFDVAGLWSYAAPRTPRIYGVEVGYRFGSSE